MAATKDRKLGPRVTVLFSNTKGSTGAGGKTGSAQYVYMLKSTADALGFTSVKNPTVTRKASKNSKGKAIKVNVRGSKGAKHIKVKDPSATAQKGKTKYYSIPVPANANISTIRTFLSKAKKKVESFVSPDGRVIGIGTGAAKGKK